MHISKPVQINSRKSSWLDILYRFEMSAIFFPWEFFGGGTKLFIRSLWCWVILWHLAHRSVELSRIRSWISDILYSCSNFIECFFDTFLFFQWGGTKGKDKSFKMKGVTQSSAERPGGVKGRSFISGRPFSRSSAGLGCHVSSSACRCVDSLLLLSTGYRLLTQFALRAESEAVHLQTKTKNGWQMKSSILITPFIQPTARPLI